MNKLLFASLIALLLFTGVDCKDDPPVIPPDNKPDTTSHDFTWTTYTFGGNAGSSYFKDVAIINDSDIWAVGAIYTSPETTYNAAHWNGKEWKLVRIPYDYQGQLFYHPISAVFALNSNDVWFAGNGVEHWDGTSFSSIEEINAVWGPYEMKKIWMNSDNSIYIVGDGGSIARFNGSVWTKQESGTTIDLQDVWGTPDGKTVWACGHSSDNGKSILLKYNGSSWNTIWDVKNGKPPYGSLVTSLWGQANLFVSSNYGVYTQTFTGQDTAKQVLSLNHYPYRIKGSAENNIVVVGDFAMIWHYNGASWKLLNETVPEQSLYSVSVSKNLIVGVGADYSSLVAQGMMYIGKK